MSASLVVAVLGVAVLDSINPSALAMTGYLLTLERPVARIRAYITAIFAVYLAIGVVVVLGIGDGVTAIVDALERPGVGFAMQGLIGVAAIAFAVRRPRPRPAGSGASRAAAVRTPWQAFVLGVTVTGVEATTALPYLGALTLIVRADVPVPAELALLIAYCLVFIAPPVLLATLGSRPGSRLRQLLDRPRRQGAGRGRSAMRWTCGIVGTLLVIDALVWAATGDALF